MILQIILFKIRKYITIETNDIIPSIKERIISAGFDLSILFRTLSSTTVIEKHFYGYLRESKWSGKIPNLENHLRTGLTMLLVKSHCPVWPPHEAGVLGTTSTVT